MSAREGMKAATTADGQAAFNITLLGPVGTKDRLSNAFSFMGMMRHLRAIEFSQEEASREI